MNEAVVIKLSGNLWVCELVLAGCRQDAGRTKSEQSQVDKFRSFVFTYRDKVETFLDFCACLKKCATAPCSTPLLISVLLEILLCPGPSGNTSSGPLMPFISQPCSKCVFDWGIQTLCIFSPLITETSRSGWRKNMEWFPVEGKFMRCAHTASFCCVRGWEWEGCESRPRTIFNPVRDGRVRWRKYSIYSVYRTWPREMKRNRERNEWRPYRWGVAE